MAGKIAASMMCADWLHLERDIEVMEREKIEYLHIDVMDGHFVPNLTLGPDYVRALRRRTRLPMDIHLMVEEPARFIAPFDPRSGDIVSLHIEADRHIGRTVQSIHNTGALALAAINPATPLVMLEEILTLCDGAMLMTVNPGFAGQTLIPGSIERIARLRAMMDGIRPGLLLEVDGNVSPANAALMARAGADLFVAGSSGMFTGEDLSAAIARLRAVIAGAAPGND